LVSVCTPLSEPLCPGANRFGFEGPVFIGTVLAGGAKLTAISAKRPNMRRRLDPLRRFSGEPFRLPSSTCGRRPSFSSGPYLDRLVLRLPSSICISAVQAV